MTADHTIELGPSHADRLYIDGSWVRPSSDASIDVIQPATEATFLVVAAADEVDVDAAVGAARRAFDRGPWPRMSPTERAPYLRALAAGLRERSAELAAIWTSQMGILHRQSRVYVPGITGIFDGYADLAASFPFIEQHSPTAGGAFGLLAREPVGVVGAITPWNSPLALIANKVAPALLAGCTVVLKAAPEAPGEAYVLAEVAEAIGLPPGVLNVLSADRDVSESLVRHPGVDKIAFTGSTAAGRRIAGLLADRIGRFTLELGGKSAALVLDDYDIGTAAAALASAACDLTGQVCAALSRVVVPRERHDEMVDALVAAFAAVVIGDPFEDATTMGPLAMRRQRDRVERYIAQGQAQGARLACGGRRPAHLDRGFFIEPTVFADVDNAATIAQEEIFGPVLAVIPVADEEEAIAVANDNIYGLNASVFTTDADRALALARRLRSGTVGHNAFRCDFGIGFGGFKQSGVGREGGREGLLPYLESKTIILDAEPGATA